MESKICVVKEESTNPQKWTKHHVGQIENERMGILMRKLKAILSIIIIINCISAKSII